MTLFLPSVTSLAVVGSGNRVARSLGPRREDGEHSPAESAHLIRSWRSLCSPSPPARPAQKPLTGGHVHFSSRPPSSLPPKSFALNPNSQKSHVCEETRSTAASPCFIIGSGFPRAGLCEVGPRSWWGSSRIGKDPACHQLGQHSSV